MPVKIKCPGCNRVFKAPDATLGKLVSCPECCTQFPVASEVGSHSAAATGVGAAGQTAGGYPAPPPVPGGPPVGPTPPGAALPVPPQGAAPVANMSGEPPRTAAVGAAPPAPDTTGSPAQPAAPAARNRRKPRFIAADSTRSRFQLGADGNLPELVLHEAASRREPKTEQEATSSPLLLIAVLGVSLVMSMLMLLVDFEGSGAQESETQIRALIEREYTNPQGEPEPYQLLLRQALQAHARGDYTTERQLLRQVLDMLHSEGNNKFTGLTGVPNADLPPNDRHLEQQLARLLNER